MSNVQHGSNIITRALQLSSRRGKITQDDFRELILSQDKPDMRYIDGGKCQICGRDWENRDVNTDSREYSAFFPVCFCDEISIDELAARRSDRMNRVNYYMERAKIPAKFWKTLSDMNQDVSESVRAGIAGATNYLKSREAHRGKWFLIFGDVGTGKTHIVCSIARYIILEYGWSVRYIRMADFIKNGISGENRDIMNNKVLILDDIDKLNPGKGESKYIPERIFSLYDNAYTNNMILLMTGNFSGIPALADIYPEPVISRIGEQTTKQNRIHITGEDYRWR